MILDMELFCIGGFLELLPFHYAADGQVGTIGPHQGADVAVVGRFGGVWALYRCQNHLSQRP